MPARWVILCCAAFALAGSVSADAYVGQGRTWPGGVVRYYNAAGDQSWAVERAVAAWNGSGARVKLVAAPAAKADVRIEHFPKISCTINAEATVGYVAQGAHLDLPPQRAVAVLQLLRGGAAPGARVRARPRPRARVRAAAR